MWRIDVCYILFSFFGVLFVSILSILLLFCFVVVVDCCWTFFVFVFVLFFVFWGGFWGFFGGEVCLGGVVVFFGVLARVVMAAVVYFLWRCCIFMRVLWELGWVSFCIRFVVFSQSLYQ